MQPGDKIGRYLLEKPLGEGAMSSVFVARHPQLEPRVAIKILRREVSADKQYADRFLEDARSAASLNHPNIVGVKDFDTADGVPFIVMELVDGWSLDQWLKEKGKLEVRDAARVARDIALGLGAAHASKIVHRDVKPSNVLMDNKTGAAKLTDFGAAKRDRPEDQQLTAHGQTIGTPRYMAPEQVHGEPVDPRTDLWALGATLFEMLAGQPAFSATSLPRLYQAIVAEDPPKLVSLRPDVPPELASLVSRLLSKSRVARPDTADEVAEALLPFTRAAPGLPPPPPPPPPVREPKPVIPNGGGIGRPALVAGGIAAVAVVAGLVYLLWPWGDGQEATQDGRPPIAVTDEGTAPSDRPAIEVANPPPAVPPAGVVGTPPTAPTEEATATAPPPVAEVEPVPPAPTPPVTPLPAEVAVLPVVDAAAVGAALADIPCLDASATVADAGVVRLVGTAADAAIATQAETAVKQVSGVRSVANEVAVAASPACLAAVEVQQAVVDSAAPPPILALNRPDGVYRDGEYLVLTATMPESFGGYLYVDMLQDDSAYHLLPEPLTPNNRVEAGQSIRIGVEGSERRAGVRDWQVTPPLHPGYLVVLATEQPLFEGTRGIEQTREAYLAALLPALRDRANGASAVAVKHLEFLER